MESARIATISAVSPAEFAGLTEYLSEYHELSVTESKGTVAVTGSGLAGALHYDAATQAVKVSIYQHPMVVTEGYLIGYLYDLIGQSPWKAKK